MLEVGPFMLQRRIGEGGMAEVWMGVLRDGGAVRAIKLLTADVLRNEVARSLFANEVRAMARLSHRAVVTIVDHGIVTDAEQHASEGKLRAGSPYLAMDLAERSAGELAGAISWEAMSYVLASLLSALAHAHARGVLHRDIKPSNVLLFSDGGVKLSDFGLADELAASGDPVLKLTTGFDGGTPSYMAPEQFARDRHLYGPATDLYALGCTAYALACGDPPFGRSDDMGAMAAAHTYQRPPPLFARQAMPDHFAKWVKRLLAKNPHDRFTCAADALRELAPVLSKEGREIVSRPHKTWIDTQSTTTFDDGDTMSKAGVDTHAHAVTTRLNPLAGLALHWIRARPVVGRERERAHLRGLLAGVDETGARMVVLTGPRGVGKSTLARALCEEAEEAGAATVLRVVHEPLGGPEHGLGAMVARWLRTRELSATQHVEHIARVLERLGDPPADAAELEALAELAGGAEDSPGTFGAVSERHTLIKRLVARQARAGRAVVLWLEDAHWGADALAFAESLLAATHSGLPLLVIACVDDDVIPERPAEARLLASLRERPATSDIALAPLDRAAHRALVENLAPLTPPLADRVTAHTAKSPLFAVQLVGNWLDAKALAQGEDGRLDLATGYALPIDVATIWQERIDRTLGGLPDAAALEVAAALGHHVVSDEWRAVCARIDVAPSTSLVERLLTGGLIWPGSGGARASWSFSHATVREAALDRARAAKRLRMLHARCAEVLAELGGATADERRARHLLAAGDPSSDADAVVWACARTRADTGDLNLAEALFAEREAALRAGDIAPDDERWGIGWLQHGRLLHRCGRRAAATAFATKARSAAKAYGWRDTLARADILLAEIARDHGDLDAAWRHLDAAARAAEDPRTRGACELARGRVLVDRGAWREAETMLAEGEQMLRAAGDASSAGAASAARARLSLCVGRFDEALARARAARQTAFECGDRYGVGRALVLMGDAARLAGRLDDAEKYYDRGLRRLEPLGAVAASAIARGKLALVALARGDTSSASRVLEEALAVLSSLRGTHTVAWMHAALALSCSHAGDWAGAARHLEDAGRTRTGTIDVELRTLTTRCAHIAEASGAAAIARAAHALALG